MIGYIIITPARDEAAFLEQTIASVAAQSEKPLQWILVDDGSRDETSAIIDHYAEKYSWITAVHRGNRGYREAGGGVVDAFYEGYAQVRFPQWQFLVKLDADLSLPIDYFERCFDEFQKDPRLGIGGGGIYHTVAGKLMLEPNPRFHVRGATKIYRRECWEGLGGLLRAPGWDTVDELKANMLGWTTRTFPELKLSHHRFTGAAAGAWRDCIKNGRANYVAGYHPLFMLVKALRRLPTKPYVVGSAGILWGFVSSYWHSWSHARDRELVRYTRQQQLRRLFFLSSIWE